LLVVVAAMVCGMRRGRVRDGRPCISFENCNGVGENHQFLEGRDRPMNFPAWKARGMMAGEIS